jgi:hypothetical protein
MRVLPSELMLLLLLLLLLLLQDDAILHQRCSTSPSEPIACLPVERGGVIILKFNKEHMPARTSVLVVAAAAAAACGQ